MLEPPALNYDLMRARNFTLSDKERKSLIDLTREMLIEKPSSEFVMLARELKNEQNIKTLFVKNPSCSYSMPYIDHEDNALCNEFWSSQLSGSYQTPGFLRSYNGSLATNVHFVLTLPLVVMDKAVMLF